MTITPGLSFFAFSTTSDTLEMERDDLFVCVVIGFIIDEMEEVAFVQNRFKAL